MVERKGYVGSVGAFLYNDADPVDDSEGDFPGEDREAFMTNGQIHVEEDPTEPFHVGRLTDLIELEARTESEAFFFSRIY